MHLAVLGMGRMGRALALRLRAGGHAVAVWNRTPGRAGAVVAAGAHEARTVAEAVRGAEAVLLSLTGDEAVLEVALGPGGVRTAAGQAALVDTSTVSPATTRAVATAFPGRMAAAPILGGPQAVTDGSAAYLLGGPRELVDPLEPLWSALSPVRRYCGAQPEMAAAVKLLCNHLLLSGIAVLAEVIAAGQAAGLGDGFLRDLLSQVPLVAPALRNRIEDLLDGEHAGWFTTRLAAKDLRLAASMAEAAGVRLPVADLVRSRYEEAAEAGWAAADVGAVVELLRSGATHP